MSATPPESTSDGVGFDPARERAIAALVEQALERTSRRREGGVDPPASAATQLAERALKWSEPRPEAIGRAPLLELAGEALRLADPRTPERETIAGWAAQRSARRAAGTGAAGAPRAPTVAAPAAAGAGARGDPNATSRALRIVALHAVELITVSWPPADAATIWHPARPSTVDQLDELAVEALAGAGERDPAAALETAEWLDQIGSEPEDLLELALHQHRGLQSSAAEELAAGLRLIVSSCAEINRKLAPDDSEIRPRRQPEGRRR